MEGRGQENQERRWNFTGWRQEEAAFFMAVTVLDEGLRGKEATDLLDPDVHDDDISEETYAKIASLLRGNGIPIGFLREALVKFDVNHSLRAMKEDLGVMGWSEKTTLRQELIFLSRFFDGKNKFLEEIERRANDFCIPGFSPLDLSLDEEGLSILIRLNIISTEIITEVLKHLQDYQLRGEEAFVLKAEIAPPEGAEDFHPNDESIDELYSFGQLMQDLGDRRFLDTLCAKVKRDNPGVDIDDALDQQVIPFLRCVLMAAKIDSGIVVDSFASLVLLIQFALDKLGKLIDDEEDLSGASFMAESLEKWSKRLKERMWFSLREMLDEVQAEKEELEGDGGDWWQNEGGEFDTDVK